ncbi:uncharacterized protein LOC109815169 [Cajanus cajan]|uniref:uncharacterized protein LOC109815169 n=1 Tax=Cajanus cajan TaxID=3821 RepID=UPI0010FB2B4E|nr:uncharacterized protein LOC109815169 [Cajanus cajan]
MDVYEHIICNGFLKGYVTWIFHGEQVGSSSSLETSQLEGEFDHDMDMLIHDAFEMHAINESDDTNVNMENGDSREFMNEPNVQQSEEDRTTNTRRNDIETHTSFESASESSSKGEKKTRGYTHMLDVWDMPDGEFILVEVDPLGNPMGWEGKTLLNAIGSLVRRHQCAPINYLSWKDMPEDYIVNMLELIQSKFQFVPELTEQAKEVLKDNMSMKWRQFKYDLKSKGYDESQTEEEMFSHIPDSRVDPSQYRDLLHYWCSEKGRKISDINKRSARSMKTYTAWELKIFRD